VRYPGCGHEMPSIHPRIYKVLILPSPTGCGHEMPSIHPRIYKVLILPSLNVSQIFS
jgi:hypothetical protein